MGWKRLESSALDPDLEAGLQARIADPLWMLSRQWQVGEFYGEDAAQPVLMSVDARHLPVRKLRPGPGGGRAEAELDLTGATPLETLVERESVRTGPAAVRLSAEAGLQFLRQLETAGLSASQRALFRTVYPLEKPTKTGLDPVGDRQLELLGRRAMSGRALAAALSVTGANPAALEPRLTFTGPQAAAVRKVAQQWLLTYGKTFSEPTSEAGRSWNPERLEHACAIAAPDFDKGVVLTADQYPGGRLDWSDFDVKKASSYPATSGTKVQLEVLPTPVRYAGMPAARWWAFEDSAVHFGDIEGGPEDLARAVIASFATTYGDDWFLVPLTVPYGSLVRVLEVRVTDNFGGTTLVKSTAENDFKAVGNSRSFRFFELKGDDVSASSPWLLVPAVPADVIEGPALEEVHFLRDEGANLAWAIEKTVESAAGRRVDRAALSARRRQLEAEADVWRYRMTHEPPEHYLPLVPVKVDKTASMRLQRGRLPVAPGADVSLRGALGLILEPTRRLLLHEEEVEETGVQVTRQFQWTRSGEGGVHLWMGRHKRPGSRQRGAGLRHDRLLTGLMPGEE